MSISAILAPDPIFPPAAGINDDAFDRVPIALPVTAVLSSDALASSATARSLPISFFSTTHDAVVAPSFAATDWYFRIHVVPANLALGNVVSNEVFTIGVWNAWLATTQTLDSINISGGDGITLGGEPDPPLAFAPNEQKNYTLTVLVEGPPTIDAVYSFVFADGEAVALVITGQRITAWALTPDWSTGVKEKLSFLTDILLAWSGREQRRALRISPRRVFSFSSFMLRQDKRFVENAINAWSAQVWALPIFPDGQYLSVPITAGALSVTCDTTERDFVAGGLAIVLTNSATFEVLQVETVSSGALGLARATVNNWGMGSKLYPVRAARMLSNPRISRESQELATISPEFTTVEPSDWPAATGLPVYRGMPVLDDSPDISQPNAAGYERQANIIDNATGSIEVDDTAGIGFPSNSHQWFMKGSAARAAFRSLMYLLKGRQGEIWVPSYDADLFVLEDITSSATNLTCDTSGVSLYAAVQNRQDIRVELISGTVFYRRVTGGAAGSQPNTELVSIDTSLGVDVPAATIRRISWMALSRLDSDDIEINHLTALDGIAQATTPFRAVNDNV